MSNIWKNESRVRHIDCFGADVISNIGICITEFTRLSSLERKDAVITDLILAARALELMNREVLYVNGVTGYEDGATLQRDFDEWLADYRAAWLRDDKPSGLDRLSEFIKHITEIPE